MMVDDVQAIDMVGDGPPEGADAARWARVGRWAAYVGGVGLLTQSVLFLLDSLDLVAPALGEVPTGGDADADLAAYFSARFARQHEAWWNIAVRDTVGPLGLLALVVAVTALVGWLGRRDPPAVLAAIDVVTAYPQHAGYLLVAGALARLWLLGHHEPRVPRWVRVVALLQAIALPLFVLTAVVGPDAVNGVLALLTGVVLGPGLAAGVAVTPSARRPT